MKILVALVLVFVVPMSLLARADRLLVPAGVLRSLGGYGLV